MPEQIRVTACDDPDGTMYTLAPDNIARGIRRRLGGAQVVLHPDTPEYSTDGAGVYIYHPGNFWDGPTHVTWDPTTGHFSCGGWGGDIHWPLIGPIQ